MQVKEYLKEAPAIQEKAKTANAAKAEAVHAAAMAAAIAAQDPLTKLQSRYPDISSLGIPGAKDELEKNYVDMTMLLAYFVENKAVVPHTEFKAKLSSIHPILVDRMYHTLSAALA